MDIEDEKLKAYEEKLLKLVDQFTGHQANIFLDEFIYKASIEYNHCEFYRDKLVTEEAKLQMRPIIKEAMAEVLAERKAAEKQTIVEIKEKLVLEIGEQFIEGKVDLMLQECCERVIKECNTERLESFYNDILDETIPKLIEKELFEVKI